MNKLIKIVAILAGVALLFLAISAKIQLAEGGEFLSGKRILVSAFFIFVVLVLSLLSHIVERITKNRK